MISSRRPPSFMPGMPCVQPGMTCVSENGIGCPPLSQDASNCSFVDQDTPTYCAVTEAPGLASAPVPTLMSRMTSLHGGGPSGMTIVGFLVVSVDVDVGGTLRSWHF